jgi:hypothetical protein
MIVTKNNADVMCRVSKKRWITVVGWQVMKPLFSYTALACALFLFGCENEESRRQKQAESERAYAELEAKFAQNDLIITNCKNAVRAKTDRNTLQFHGGTTGSFVLKSHDGSPHDGYAKATDNGYLYRLIVSDASFNGWIDCYTDRQGQVVRLLPTKSY